MNELINSTRKRLCILAIFTMVAMLTVHLVGTMSLATAVVIMFGSFLVLLILYYMAENKIAEIKKLNKFTVDDLHRAIYEISKSRTETSLRVQVSLEEIALRLVDPDDELYEQYQSHINQFYKKLDLEAIITHISKATDEDDKIHQMHRAVRMMDPTHHLYAEYVAEIVAYNQKNAAVSETVADNIDEVLA